MQLQLHKVSLLRIGWILTELHCKRNECHISSNNLESMEFWLDFFGRFCCNVKYLVSNLLANYFCQYHQAEPTGLLIDAAMKLVLPWIPEVSVDERREAFLRASNLALTRGVTTVVDFGRFFPGASVKHSWEDLSGSATTFGVLDACGIELFNCILFWIIPWTWNIVFRKKKWFHYCGHNLLNWIVICEGGFYPSYREQNWNEIVHNLMERAINWLHMSCSFLSSM